MNATVHPRTPYEAPEGPGRLAVAAAIAFSGLAVLVSLAVWLVHVGDADTSVAMPPAAATTTADAMADMPGMAVMTAANAAPQIALPANAAALAAAHQPAPVELPPLAPGHLHHYTITLKDETFDVAPGIHYTGWTFDGGAPGPVIHVRQGDWVDVTLKNGGAIPHSIDFHAADIAPNTAFASVPNGGSIHFRFQATTAGAFMYHCGTPPVLAHIANGMYGAIVVDPKQGMPKVERSFVLVASEWYLAGQGGSAPYSLDMAKARAKMPDFVSWNGYAGQYKDHPLTANVGDTARFYVVSAGPSFDTDFHVVGTVLRRVYLDGTTRNVLRDVQTQLVPAGGGMVFDVTFHQKGIYPFVSHSFASVDMGQLGLVNVGQVPGTMSH